MKKVLIIGAGAMGAAFSVPLIDNNQKVTLTEPYNLNLLKKLKNKKKFHPALKINLPNKLNLKKFSPELLNDKWDLIVIAVSSVGIDMIKNYLKDLKQKTLILVLTKGLKFQKKNKKLISMSEQLNQNKKNLNISILKGPCLAKELARKVKSYTVIANKNISVFFIRDC